MAGIKDMLRDFLGTTEGKAILREAQPAATPPAAGARPELPAEERRALGAELAQRYDLVVLKGEEQAEREIQEAAGRLRKAEQDLVRIAERRSLTRQEYIAFRDPTMARLWAERPALVDELIARVETEARELKVKSFVLPPGPDDAEHILSQRPSAGEIVREDGALVDMPRVLSTGTSVRARQGGLRDLAEAIRDATCKGEWATTEELGQLFSNLYAALPAVESLADVASQDVRGRKFVKAVQALERTSAA